MKNEEDKLKISKILNLNLKIVKKSKFCKENETLFIFL